MVSDHFAPTLDRPPPFDLPTVEEVTDFEPGNEGSVLGLAELLLKDPDRLDWLARDEARQPLLIPSFLVVGLASFSLFALALVLTLAAVPPAALPGFLADQWLVNRPGSAAALWIAYAVGFTLTTGVCLPSFYFYGLLAGARISWLQVTAQVMKGQAATAVMLLGILPIYLAGALGAVVLGVSPDSLRVVLYVGLGLPFVAGLWGVRSIHRGFLGLADTLPADRRCNRECWLRRLTAACGACYTAVCPVMIYSLWAFLAERL